MAAGYTRTGQLMNMHAHVGTLPYSLSGHRGTVFYDYIFFLSFLFLPYVRGNKKKTNKQTPQGRRTVNFSSTRKRRKKLDDKRVE